jgi:hypothetical protein
MGANVAVSVAKELLPDLLGPLARKKAAPPAEPEPLVAY